MKIVIDIPERTYNWVSKNGCIAYGDDAYYIGLAIKNGTVLPKNATNGDMIKAVFPNLEKDKDRLIQEYGSQSLYDTYAKWCKLPYKAGDTDGFN